MWRGSCDHHMTEAVISITYSNDVRDIPFSEPNNKLIIQHFFNFFKYHIVQNFRGTKFL